MAITVRDIEAKGLRGQITYDDYFGHVCACTAAVDYDAEGNPERPSYLPTRCGAGTWSGL